MSATAPNPTAPVIAEDVLNSWKEIACYLNRGVRTVQRWEAELGLPVRRPRGRSRSAVIAIRSDIDKWLRACPVSAGEPAANAASDPGPNHAVMRGSISAEIERSRWLRQNLAQAREDFDGALSRLMSRLVRMAVPQSLPPGDRSESGLIRTRLDVI